MPEGAVLAIDIGGTKAAAARVVGDGTVVDRAQVTTGRGGDHFPAIAGLLRQVARGDEVACGIACAGPVFDHRTVSPVNLPAWQRFPLRDRVAEATGLPTFLDVDTKGLALAEGRFGAAVGIDDYLAMVVSTGIGAGIVSGGQLLEGATGNAGYVGHVIVTPEGRQCGCGARGCVEAEASGHAIAARTGRPADEAPLALRVEVGRLVGRAVASAMNLLDLRLAVVSGSVALGFGEPFFAAAQAELDRRCRLEFTVGAHILPSRLADGPLLGAACVAWRGQTGPSWNRSMNS